MRAPRTTDTTVAARVDADTRRRLELLAAQAFRNLSGELRKAIREHLDAAAQNTEEAP